MRRTGLGNKSTGWKEKIARGKADSQETLNCPYVKRGKRTGQRSERPKQKPPKERREHPTPSWEKAEAKIIAN